MSLFRTNNPTQFGEVDGIVIDETAPAPNVAGVPANIACLVGRFQRGPENSLQVVSSIGDFHAMFGKSNYSGNLELKNKTFGSLRVIRALASNAAKAALDIDNAATDGAIKLIAKYAGAYGNNLSALVKHSPSNAKAAGTLTAVADVASSLDADYFILQDSAGSVAFWIDVGDSGTTIPAGASAADRAIEITTIEAGDAATVVATKISTAINADSQFTASATGTIVSWESVFFGQLPAPAAGSGAFALILTNAGVYYGHEIVVTDNNAGSVVGQEIHVVDAEGITQEKLNEIFSESLLVSAELLDADERLVAAASADLVAGADGDEADGDYEEAIAAAEVQGSCNVIFTDKYSNVIRLYLKNHLLANPDKMAVFALDTQTQNKANAKAAVIALAAQNRDVDGRIILGFNPIKTFINGAEVKTSPASWIASIVSNTSPHIDPAFVENAQFTQGASGLEYALSRQDYIDLLQAGVAAFENDPNFGIKLKSGVATQILNSSKTQILRRRMADFLTESVGLFLKNYQNAPNTKANRSLVGAAILGFDESLIQSGILPSDSEVQDGLARLIDTEGANTNLSIGQGFFKIIYKRRIHSSMRFIVLQAEIGETVVVTEEG